MQRELRFSLYRVLLFKHTPFKKSNSNQSLSYFGKYKLQRMARMIKVKLFRKVDMYLIFHSIYRLRLTFSCLHKISCGIEACNIGLVGLKHWKFGDKMLKDLWM